MKNFLVITITLLSCTFLMAQNYHPFPLGQKSFWKNGNQVTQYYCDQKESLDIDTDLLLFGAEYLFPDMDCLEEIVNFYATSPILNTLIEIAHVDSLFFSVGRLYPIGQSSQYIQTDASLDDHWTVFPTEVNLIDSIVWSVTAIATENWLNDDEQVKRFEGLRYQGGDVVDELALVLSEEHGFLQFTPFHKWWSSSPAQEEIFGWEVGDEKAGFTHSFEDYFDIAPGSILKYRTHYWYFGYNVFRDSVMSSSIDETGLTYTVNRHTRHAILTPLSDPDTTQIDSLYYTTEILELHIPRERYLFDFQATPGWFFKEDSYLSSYNYGFRKIDTLSLDVNGIVHLTADPGIAFEDNCEYNGVVDNWAAHTYRLGQGLGWVGEYYIADIYATLIGYDTPMGSDGDYTPIEIILGTGTPIVNTKAIQIYPNPNNGQFKIQLDEKRGPSALVLVRNIEGKTVFSKRFEGMETALEVSAGKLPSGLYSIVVLTDGYLYSSLWSKE